MEGSGSGSMQPAPVFDVAGNLQSGRAIESGDEMAPVAPALAAVAMSGEGEARRPVIFPKNVDIEHDACRMPHAVKPHIGGKRSVAS